MKKNRNYIYLIFILLFLACNTTENEEEITVAESDTLWSAFEPINIPYKIRLQEFEKQNLIPNFSFEDGKKLQNDSAITNFELNNWEIIGKNIEWTDTNLEIYDSAQAVHKNHAIKIHRKQEDVQEIDNKASGILSDFIEVIPGNYLFFIDIRLEKIFPSNKRLNSKIGEDIDIHIEYYDKNKKRLSDGIYFEYYNKDVDNSFKGFSFSNFYYIENFEWGQVRGRTLNYPFSEGDMPEGCRYIKIFLGLKSRGTMWVDNIDFRFSRWNFTSLERIKPFFDTTYHKADLLIPTPQHISNKKQILL